MIAANTKPERDYDDNHRDDHIPRRIEAGLCVCCEGLIFGTHYVEPRRGFPLCLSCVRGGNRRATGSHSSRVIEEARVQIGHMDIRPSDSDYLLVWDRLYRQADENLKVWLAWREKLNER